MQTVSVVLGVLNKSNVKRLYYTCTGPKGYGLLLVLRLLLYSVLAEIFSTRQLVKHLKKNPQIRKKLGFKKVPTRRTIDGWFEKYPGFRKRYPKGSFWSGYEHHESTGMKDFDASKVYIVDQQRHHGVVVVDDRQKTLGIFTAEADTASPQRA